MVVANKANLKKYAKELLAKEYCAENVNRLLNCKTLEDFNKVLRTCGIEGQYCNRKPELSFEYCNVGDPYILTILKYKDKLRIGTYGEIVEKYMKYFD